MRRQTRGNNKSGLLLAVLTLATLLEPPGTAAQYQQSFPMPDVTGLTTADAEKRVTAAGSNAGARSARAVVVDRLPDDRPAGRIIRQLDAPGTPMRPYRDDVGGVYGQVTFRVVLSSGPEPAPDFIGQSRTRAEQYARQNRIRLTFGSAVRDSGTPAGVIVRQSPPPGQPMSGRRVTVNPSAGYPLPDYVGESYASARRDAVKLGFRIDRQTRDNLDYPPGIIIDQQPPPDTLLPLKIPVRVTVSTGWPLPDFVGRNERDAEAMAAKIRVRLNPSPGENPRVPAGVIAEQRPRAGDPVPENRIVDVLVSRGYPLPDLTGKTENDVRQLSQKLGFRVDISRDAVRERAAGIVDRQAPEPGTLLPFDGAVRVVVSEGWPTPDFLHMQEQQAEALASEAQVSLTVAERKHNREARPGTVLSQNPEPGALLPPGQPVRLVISGGYPTPGFIDLPEAEAESLAGRERIELDKQRTASVDVNQGIVISQVPEPGTPLPADNRVSVILSSGWPVPDFVGRSRRDADTLAAESRIELVMAEPEENMDIGSGRVFSQTPAAGDVVPDNRQVTIALSLGWPVAPDAMGRMADSLEEEFRAVHPGATVEIGDRLLTLESPGIIVSQSPGPGIKLGADQRLLLVRAAPRPPWFWPLVGFVLVTAVGGGTASIRRLARPDIRKSTSATGTSPTSEDPGGVRVRVTRDPGEQSTDTGDDDETAVRLKVTIDLGEQSAGPVESEGEKP